MNIPNMQMTNKNNPKTIADLKINWFFDEIQNFRFNDFQEKFDGVNPKIKNLKILIGSYTFLIDDHSFVLEYSEECYGAGYNLWYIMDDIIHKLWRLNYTKVPEKFEYLGNNEFRIHLKR